jgi:hypothetical protein
MTKRPVLILLPKSLMEGVVKEGLRLRSLHGLICGHEERLRAVEDVWGRADDGAGARAGAGQSWEENGDDYYSRVRA